MEMFLGLWLSKWSVEPFVICVVLATEFMDFFINYAWVCTADFAMRSISMIMESSGGPSLLVKVLKFVSLKANALCLNFEFNLVISFEEWTLASYSNESSRFLMMGVWPLLSITD